MRVQTARPAGPAPTQFAGQTPARIVKRLFHATRPRFFPASVLPVLAGTAWGVHASGQMDAAVFVLAMLATVCVHAGSNVLNDVADDAIGTDRRNDDRIYPYTGGSRFIQTGILDGPGMLRLGSGLLLVAVAAGTALVIAKGPVVVLFGATGIALGILYSLGPLRLSALGLGETAVAAAFGILPVTGAAWLQEAPVEPGLLRFALPISAWVAAILLINEVPDIDPDRAAGKRTLPVRLGLAGTARLYLAIQVMAPAVVVASVVAGELPLVASLLPLGLLVPAFRATAAIRAGLEDRAALRAAIESTLAVHALGTLWLAGCVLYDLW